MPKSDQELKSLHFTRDPALAGEIADAFGGGGGDATALIQANELRYPQELAGANDTPAAQKRSADGEWLLTDLGEDEASAHEAIADAADLEPDALLAWDLRGGFITYLFEGPDGRTGKDVLLVDGEDLSMPEREDTPERAALRAQATTLRAVKDAKSEADEIVAKAKEEAARIVAEAAAKVTEARQADLEKVAQDAADKREEEANGDGGGDGGDAGSGDGDGGDSGGSPYEGMSFDDLKAEAQKRELQVEGTGKNGAVKASDVKAALEADDK